MNDCTCDTCKAMCRTRPCWGTPAELKRIMDDGNAMVLMRDYWVRYKIDPDDEDSNISDDIDIICPAIVGSEGESAPSWPKGQCALQTADGLCAIHAIKPMEGRVATCKHTTDVHKEIAMLWDSDEGRAVVKEWMKLVG